MSVNEPVNSTGLPSYVVAHTKQVVVDNSKVDYQTTKIGRGIIVLPLDLIGNNSPISDYDALPTLAGLNLIIADPQFDYGNDLATPYPVIDAIAEYILMDEGAAFPADFPTYMEWMRNFTVEEKLLLSKSAWRTKNFHAMLPHFFAAMQLVMLLAARDLNIIEAGKVRIIDATVFPDTKLQIPYVQTDPTTWKAHEYRTVFNINNIYTMTERETMLNHIYATLDTYGFKTPLESVKMMRMTLGKFKNFVMDDKLDIKYDHWIDLIITEETYDFVVFGNDWTNDIEGWMTKLQPYLTSATLVYEKIEYNDKFYSKSFPMFKDMMESVAFDSTMLAEWGEIIPWFQIGAGWHYDNVQLRNELIFRGWNNANYGNHHVLSLGNGGQTEDMFTRQNAGLNAGVANIDFIYQILPYGCSEEMTQLAITWFWMFMMRFMGGYLLPNDLEINSDIDTVLFLSYYQEFYDTDGNLVYVMFYQIAQPTANAFVGWIALIDTAYFNDLYKPRELAPGGYNGLADTFVEVPITGNYTWDGVNNDNYFERILRKLPHTKYQHPMYQRSYFKELTYKCINPKIAPRQEQPPEIKKLEADLTADVDKQKSNAKADPMLKPESKPSPISEQEIKKVESEVKSTPELPAAPIAESEKDKDKKENNKSEEEYTKGEE
jgi:hypothetical protein